MADPLSIIASAITVGATAAQLSLALFNITQTVKNAPKEIAEIAEEISTLSASLTVLGDVLQWQQSICKPELFVQIRTTLARFNSIEEQLQKLTEKTKLERLKWFFKGPKSKGLLKKVESIKSALNLILNIIRLATEASAGQQSNTVPSPVSHQHQIQQQNSPSASSSSSVPPLPPPPPSPPPNRFRKVVESIVQASRLAVERAQEENAANPTEKRRHYNSELQRWQSDSNDTATWLYHLVFSSGGWNEHSGTTPKRLEERSFAVTIEDYDSDESSQGTASLHTVKDAPQNPPDQKPESTSQVIVWNSKTEPSLVVDRLLQSWTYLNEVQIQASKATYPSGWNKSGESLMNGPKDDAKARSNTSDDYTSNTSSFSDEEMEWDEYIDETESEKYIPPPKRPSPPPRPSRVKETPVDAKPGVYSFPRRGSSNNRQLRPKPEGLKPTSFNPINSHHDTAHSHAVNARYEIPDRRYDAKRSTGWPAGWPVGWPEMPTNIAETPFTSPPLYHIPPPPFYTAPLPTHPIPSFSPYNAMPIYQPSSAPPRPHSPALSDASFYTASPHLSPQLELNTPNEEAIFSKLETVLLGRPISDENKVSDSNFSRLESLIMGQLDTQRVTDDRKETEGALALELIEATENEKLYRLEKLLIEQGEDQVRRQAESVAIRRAETAEWETKVAKEAKEARELSEQQIATAMAAKRSAEEMLKYVKEQAAERAREQAEAKAAEEQAEAAEERRKTEEDYKRRIETYEEKLAEFTRGWQEQSTVKDYNSTPVPLRTTRIIEGGRQIEVSEFSRERLEPFIDITSQIMPMNWTQAGLLNPNSLASRNQTRPHLENTHNSSLNAISDMNDSSKYSATASAQSLGETQPSQSVILLPSQLDRSSTKMSEMQTSLESCGVLTTFDAMDRGVNNALVQSEARNPDLIRSTIFWEPPLLSLGSELLGSLRVKGWKLFYIRKSDAGQTYFLGHQPFHVHFFKPDYQPQFKESPIYSDSEYIIIAKDLVEKYALLELGFQFNPTDAGAYTLDCRLTAGDIEALIDRSFMIRETNYRRLYRQLQWAPHGTYTNPPPSEDDGYAPSLTSETTTSTSSRYGDYHDRETVYEDDTPIVSPTNDSRDRQMFSASEVGDMKLYESGSPEEDRDQLLNAISTGFKKRRQLRLRAAKGEDL